MLAPKINNPWRPATVDDVKRILQRELNTCSPEEAAAFQRHAIEPFPAHLVRFGNKEAAIVVARNQNTVIYWEDVEEGFNISPISSEGIILERSCTQDTLGQAVRHWL